MSHPSSPTKGKHVRERPKGLGRPGACTTLQKVSVDPLDPGDRGDSWVPEWIDAQKKKAHCTSRKG
jgi:hypothetical protein